MDDTSFDLLCKGLSPNEAKLFRKIMKEWCAGDEDSFPVQLALLTKAQWLAAGRLPQLVTESGSVIEQQMESCRLKVACIVGNLSAASRENTIELRNIIKAHAEKVNESGVLVRNQLWQTEATAKEIAAQLLEGCTHWKAARNDFINERKTLEQERKDLAKRVQIRDGIYWGFIAFGLLAFGGLLEYWWTH